jgi:transposase
MWTAEHRRFAARKGLRYPSDLTDGEWALIEPMIPPAKRGGRRREVNIREVLNAIFYVLSTGCQWQALPKDLPPKSTAHSYFMLWDWTARWSASTMRSMSRPASATGARRARVLRSSTARAPRPLKKGLRA